MSELSGGNSPRKRLGRIKKTLVFLAAIVGKLTRVLQLTPEELPNY